jgi:arylsulfatase A-like enzyme
MAQAKPNIVFIMADQLAAQFLPFHGHPLVKTPYLSRLAAEGVVFDNCYSTSPLCSPARATIMNGLLPSRTGVYDNAAEFPSSIPTWAHYLRLAGYKTCLSGKMHFVGPDQLAGRTLDHRHLSRRFRLDTRLAVAPGAHRLVVSQHDVRAAARHRRDYKSAGIR